MTSPKIELHVHREGTVRSETLLEAAASLGVEPLRAYENGVAGALCDDATRERLRSIGESFDWRSLP